MSQVTSPTFDTGESGQRRRAESGHPCQFYHGLIDIFSNQRNQKYMSEGSSQLLTQPVIPFDSSTYSDGQTIVGCGLTQAKKEAVNKPRFVDFACSHSEVGIMCLRVFSTLIVHERSFDMLYWSRKKLSLKCSGEGRRTSRLSNVVGGAALNC